MTTPTSCLAERQNEDGGISARLRNIFTPPAIPPSTPPMPTSPASRGLAGKTPWRIDAGLVEVLRDGVEVVVDGAGGRFTWPAEKPGDRGGRRGRQRLGWRKEIGVRMRKRWMFLGGLAAILAVALLMASRSPVFAALTKSTSAFAPSATDPRVLFEDGAEDQAARVAAFLGEAIAIIEGEHGRPVEKPFLVFVCATQLSLNEFLANPPTAPIRGAVRFGDVFLAPSAFLWQGQDLHRESLLHEMSHLHLRQHLGFLAFRGRVPSWFHEGLADLVSGAGGEGVTEAEAMEAIQAGRALSPEPTGRLWTLRRIADNGLGGPMFHRQSRMFLTYIRDRNPAAFQTLLRDLLEEKELAGPFRTHFGLGTEEMWQEFVASFEGAR